MKVSEELRLLCQDYARYQSTDNVAKAKYLLMNQHPSKLYQNCYRGKFAECVVYSTLIMANKPCTMPNFITGAHKRYKYDPDLISGENKLHIKSVWLSTHINPYKENYFLINQDDHLFKHWNSNDWFVIVAINELDSDAESYSVVKWVKVGDVINKARPHTAKQGKMVVPY